MGAPRSPPRSGRCRRETSRSPRSAGTGSSGGSWRRREGDAARVASRGLAWPLFNASALQAWILLCSQGPRGGLRDKPGKAQDHYHTCYCLSGLAAAQMYSGTVLGPGGNALREIDILLNVRTDRAEAFAELLRRSGVA